MIAPCISIERRQNVAIVTIQNEENRNTLTSEMLDEIASLFPALSHDRDLRAVILTGAGAIAFCSGMDVPDSATVDGEGAFEAARRGQHACDIVAACEVPVIAAINGAAEDLGFELAMAAHLRVAASHATFNLPGATLGTIPAYGGTQRLQRIVGVGRADELIATAAVIDAAKAFRIGLVNRIVEPSAALTGSLSLAAEIANLAPLAIRACLRAVTCGSEMSIEDGLELEARLFSELFATEDVREGTRAFLEKRKPVFRGR
jgi:enoyl-CoA hydratase